MPHYLGIEIGGTKIQVGVGPDDGRLRALWRETVDVPAGPEGIRRQLLAGVADVLHRSGIARHDVRAVGIGFGGPVDDATSRVIKSHQIAGWDDYPLAAWISETVGFPAVLGNDADVAGLGEAVHGAGKGCSPLFYITLGSGIGGGFILEGEIYRGVGRGAAELGHMRFLFLDGPDQQVVEPLENRVSGWGIARVTERDLRERGQGRDSPLRALLERGEPLTTAKIAEAALAGDAFARATLRRAWGWLADAICQMIALLCPRRVVIGGGVSLMGEELLFGELRRLVAERTFRPFMGLTDIVPAALGEEVVLHGAIALARKRLG